MTLQPRPSGSINSVLTFGRRSAEAVRGIPVSSSLPQLDQVMEYRNSQLQPADYHLSAIPQITLTWQSASTITINPGSIVTNIGGRRLVKLSSAITKSLANTWVAGTGQGGRFNASVSNVTYHVFVIFNPSTGEVDAGFDTSVTAANRPSGWLARRVGSVLRRSSNILKFVQLGHYFELDVPVVDIQDVYVPTTATLYTLTTPLGLGTIARIVVNSGLANFTAQQLVLGIQSPGATSMTLGDSSLYSTFAGSISSFAAESGIDYTFTTSTNEFRVATNTSSQIQVKRAQAYGAIGTTVQTLGWEDVQLYCGG